MYAVLPEIAMEERDQFLVSVKANFPVENVIPLATVLVSPLRRSMASN
jgi:hypothetical protein